VAPIEAKEFLKKQTELLGGTFVDETTPVPPTNLIRPVRDILYPFQKTAVLKALAAWTSRQGGLLFNLETGLGKTLCSIEASRCAYEGGNILVVCPAVVREVWHQEIQKWDSDRDPIIRVAETGKHAGELAAWLKGHTKSDKTCYFVTSYALLKHFAQVELRDRLAVMIADEVHMLASENTIRSKAWRVIRRNNPEALAIGNTATPVPDRITQIAGQVNSICPGRFGGKWKFAQRYHYCTDGEYGGLDVGDIKQEFLPELQQRLDAVSVRVTKHEVAHLLPPLTTQKVEIPYKREDLDLALEYAEDDFGSYIRRYSRTRIKEAINWLESTGQSHVCALSFHVSTAVELTEALRDKGHMAICITGQDSPERRHKLIEKSLKLPQCFLVCSMKSIGVGVDVLAGYSTALFVELSYRPMDVVQAIGRFYRLSSLYPVLVAFLLLRGTLDDVLMEALRAKLEQFSQTLKAGVTEEELESVLKGKEESEDEFFARMRGIVDGYEE
jgi:SNF2 family DNA or RNA helicase